MDEQEMIEKMFDDGQAGLMDDTDGTDQNRADLSGKEVVQESQKTDDSSHLPVNKFREAAFEAAKKFLNKKDIKDEDIENTVYQGYTGAQKRIQAEIKARQEYENKVKEYEPYYKFSQEYLKSPFYKALSEGRITQQDLSDVINGKARLVRDNDGNLEAEEIPAWAKKLEGKFDEVSRYTMTQKQREDALAAQRDAQEKAEAHEKQLKDIERKTFERFADAKTWYEQSKKQGYATPEWEGVLNVMKQWEDMGQNINLYQAVMQYYQENKLPEVLKNKEKETVDNLKKKADKNPESFTANRSESGKKHYFDARDLVTDLIGET